MAVGRPWLLLVNQVLLPFQSVPCEIAVGVVGEYSGGGRPPCRWRPVDLVTFGTPWRVVNL